MPVNIKSDVDSVEGETTTFALDDGNNHPVAPFNIANKLESITNVGVKNPIQKSSIFWDREMVTNSVYRTSTSIPSFELNDEFNMTGYNVLSEK